MNGKCVIFLGVVGLSCCLLTFAGRGAVVVGMATGAVIVDGGASRLIACHS